MPPESDNLIKYNVHLMGSFKKQEITAETPYKAALTFCGMISLPNEGWVVVDGGHIQVYKIADNRLVDPTGENDDASFYSNTPVETSSYVDQSKTFLGGDTHPWRRFFARTMDEIIWACLFFYSLGFFIIYALPDNATNLLAIIVSHEYISAIIACLLWLPIEAIFLAVIGTTLGKWLFGIRVIHASGKKLSYFAALKRANLLFLQGEGIGIPLVVLFTRAFAYRRLTKTGTTLWDASVNSVVTHEKWGLFRIFLLLKRSDKPEGKRIICEAKDALDLATKAFDNEANKMVCDVVSHYIKHKSKDVIKLVNDSNGKTAKEWVWGQIGNISGDLLESGAHHFYRGVLTPTGNDLLKIFDHSFDQLVAMNALDIAFANQQRAALLKTIKRMG